MSLQSSQAEEQREELEWKEGTSEKSIRVVKIRQEVQAVTEQHEELEMERNLMRLDMHTDKDKLTGGEILAYKEREEVDEQDNEWFHLLGGRSFHTQHSLSSLSPGKFNLLLSVCLCLHFNSPFQHFLSTLIMIILSCSIVMKKYSRPELNLLLHDYINIFPSKCFAQILALWKVLHCSFGNCKLMIGMSSSNPVLISPLFGP